MKKHLLTACGALLLMGCISPSPSPEGQESGVSNDAAPDTAGDVRESPDVMIPPPPTNPPDGSWVDGSFDLAPTENDPMIYQGGAVLTNPINVYYIWYGKWVDTNTAPVLEDFIKNLGSSPWLQMDTAYYQQAGVEPPEA